GAAWELHGGVEGGRASAADLVRVHDRLGVVRRPVRGGEVAPGHGDLYLGEQMSEPQQRLLRLGNRPPKARRGGVDLTAREAQERQPGLGVLAELVGTCVRLFGGGEV